MYTLEKHDGNGDGATVTTANIKSEWCELRLYLSMHCRVLSMAEVLRLLTTETTIPPHLPQLCKVGSSAPDPSHQYS